MPVVVAPVGEEFGHVVDVRVAAFQFMLGANVVDADEKGLNAVLI
jgi:hypothetical protein